MKEFRDNLQRLNISVRNLVEEGDKKQKQIDVSLILLQFHCHFLS